MIVYLCSMTRHHFVGRRSAGRVLFGPRERHACSLAGRRPLISAKPAAFPPKPHSEGITAVYRASGQLVGLQASHPG
jgi:hypothetical protein